MEWTSIRYPPDEDLYVLVASNLYGDQDLHFFPAYYWKREHQWRTYEHTSSGNFTLIFHRKILEDDAWTYIEMPDIDMFINKLASKN